MKRQTLLKAWAAFGFAWFVIFTALTFAPQGLQTVVIIAALSLYAGMILAIISAATLLYELIRPRRNKPETSEECQ